MIKKLEAIPHVGEEKLSLQHIKATTKKLSGELNASCDPDAASFRRACGVSGALEKGSSQCFCSLVKAVSMFVTESQGGLGWKGPLRSSSSNLLL